MFFNFYCLFSYCQIYCSIQVCNLFIYRQLYSILASIQKFMLIKFNSMHVILLQAKFTRNINHRYFNFLFELPSNKMLLIGSKKMYSEINKIYTPRLQIFFGVI